MASFESGVIVVELKGFIVNFKCFITAACIEMF